MKQIFTVLFGGEAGYGTMSAGAMVAKAAVRHGLWAHSVNEYPSLIKGGLNTSQIVISPEKVTSAGNPIDFMAVVSQKALQVNLSRLRTDGVLLYDSSVVKIENEKIPASIFAVGIDVAALLPTGMNKVMGNAVLLGAFAGLTGFPADWLRDTLVSQFEKNPEIAELNGALFDKAYKEKKSPKNQYWQLTPRDNRARLVMNGNEAIALGALAGGVRFSAGYPMTPGTSVLSYLSDQGKDFGLVFKQSEDELAAMNMLVGASFAGARAMGSTSCGGFALMTEALGFAGQAELPVTMVVAQRGGPSTGLPTRTMQGDLDVALYAGAGEIPRIVVAPGDVDECFYETFHTLNLADQYQLAAIILTDKELADSSTTVEAFETQDLKNERKSIYTETPENYQRYEDTPSGVSPRTLPGTVGGSHIATSYTHQPDGFYSSGNLEYAKDEATVTRMSIDKTYRKFSSLKRELASRSMKLHGPAKAAVTIVGWGGSKGAILEALAQAKDKQLSVNFLQLIYLSPFPSEEVARILSDADKLLLVEGNATGQLGKLIRQETGIFIENKYLKYDALPFSSHQIFEKVQEVLTK